MQSRVMNKPYDVFGTWYNDCYLLSGNLHWTGHLNSCSVLWLNKVSIQTRYPATVHSLTTFSTPAKFYSNGVSLVGR